MQARFPWCQQEVPLLRHPPVITRWGKTLPTTKVGSPGAEEEEGQEHPRTATPGDSSCCPPAPVLQGKLGVSSSCCTSQTPRTTSASWGAPGPGTQLPWMTPLWASSHPEATLGGGEVPAEQHPHPASLPSDPREMCWGCVPHNHPEPCFFSTWSFSPRKICLKM